MAESCKLEEVIIKAIPEIREKGHKKPTINTITKRLEQENCSYSEGEIKEAVERLIRRGQVENRGKNGEESLYVVTPDVMQKPNPCPNANAKCTPYEEFILLRTQVETLLKASRSNHGNNVGKQSEKEKELKEELLLLKKENESLKNEIRRKDLLINSMEKTEKPDTSEFQFPRRRNVAKIDSSISPWDCISTSNNRFTPIAPPLEDVSLTTEIQRGDKVIQPMESAAKISTGLTRVKTSTNQSESSRSSMDKRKKMRSWMRPPVHNSTEIIGDSMVKQIQGYKMSEATNGQEKIFVRAFHGAKVDDMNSYSVPTTKKNPRRIVIHCGTNDISSGTVPNEVAEEIVDLATNLKSHENEVFVSGIVARGDRWNERVSQVNNVLKAKCNREGLPFIDNSNIEPAHHLNRSNLHLNSEGTRMLANNFLRALGHY